MEAKYKAKELVELFWDRIKGDTMYSFHVHQKNHTISFIQAKACAIICVDEILEMEVWDWPHNTPEGKLFWQQVKEEIKNL